MAAGAGKRGGLGRESACVLVSGGLDSAVLLRETARSFGSVQPLYIRSGLVWEPTELRHLRRLLHAVRSRRIRPLVVIDLPMGDVCGSHWSISGRRSPGFHDGDASVYIPGRNVALLSKAATFCALRKIRVLVSGILSANPFPDGAPAFFRAMERALGLGLGAPIRIRTPFRSLTKEQVIRRGSDLPLRLTFSCIHPKRGRHCGDCCKCAERTIAFRRAGLPDPTVYAGGPGAVGAGSREASARASASIRARTTRVAPKKTTSSR